MKQKLSLKSKILLLALTPFLIFNLAMMVSSYYSTKNALIAEKKFEIQDVISSSLGVLNTLESKVQKGELTKEQAQSLASDYIKNMRYGRDGKDYIWVQDFQPNMIVHPSAKLVGTSLKAFKDKDGFPLFNEVVKLVQKNKEGYVTYTWNSKDDPNKLVPKLSFVKGFEPWGWILGTGIYIDDVNAYINNLMMRYIGFSALGLIVMALIISYVLKVGVAAPLLNIADKLKETASQVTIGSDSTLETSEVLSKATHDQAASLQQTVASIDEISAMINRNSDSAQESTRTSNLSQKAAEQGKTTVDEMLSSIRAITENNQRAMNRMDESNKQISEILNIIREIDDKTKVINDIVFQTKLLSFNASVEAARAGESGKGFAVVAEEVGNLATMSGKASDEIRELLDQSIKQVEGIVEQTTGMVEALIEEGKTTVDDGTNKANECKDALDEILGNVQGVNLKVNEIAEACGEQATGVDEITKAMRMLDEVTHQNNDAAQKASVSAGSLREQAQRLDQVVGDVIELVNGKAA